MCRVCRNVRSLYVHVARSRSHSDGPNLFFFGIVKWLLEGADKNVSSNIFLAARMLTEAKSVASGISQNEVKQCDQAWADS